MDEEALAAEMERMASEGLSADEASAAAMMEMAGMGGQASLEDHPLRSAIDRFGDVEVRVEAILGRTSMPIEQFLKLSRGVIIELDQGKDEDIHMRVHNITVAKAEIVLDENKVNVQLKDIAFKNKMYSLDK